MTDPSRSRNGMTEPDAIRLTAPVIDLRDHPNDDSCDAALLARVREGDDAAYGELWARHAAGARRVASRLVPRADVEDLVSEAFERTLAAIRSGRGPESTFFPYVARALRGRAATLLAAKARVTLADDLEILDSPVEDADPFHGAPAKARLVQAFQDLPSRWQDALWVSVVEDQPPRRVAALLGTSPNGVSALLIRARRQLRSNFIDLTAAESRNPLCRQAIQAPSRYADHVAGCDYCEATLAGLAELDVNLRSRGLPIVALIGSAVAQAASPHRRLRDLLGAVPAKVAVAAVAVTAAGVGAGPSLLAPSDRTPAAPLAGPAAGGPAIERHGPRPVAVQAGPVLPTALPTSAPPTAQATPSPTRPVTPSPATPRPGAAHHATTHRATTAAREVASSGSAAPVAPKLAPTPDAARTTAPVAPVAAGGRHPIGIEAHAGAACGCARVKVTGVRVSDQVAVSAAQPRAPAVALVRHPAHAGNFRLAVAAPSGPGPLTVTVTVVRANGRTVTARLTLLRD
jgi:RNA polymerase sigma factor (sigma-70 family)